MDWLAVASFVCTRKRLMHAKANNHSEPSKCSVVELAMGDIPNQKPILPQVVAASVD